MPGKQYSSRYPWPIAVAMVLGVVVPTLCVLWMMTGAVKNERLTMQQKVQDIYLHQVQLFANEWRNIWGDTLKDMSKDIRRFSEEDSQNSVDNAALAQGLFAYIAENTMAKSSHIYSNNQLLYPYRASVAVASDTSSFNNSLLWQDAENFEYGNNDCTSAISIYQEILGKSDNTSEQGQALAARARCEVRLGNIHSAIDIYDTLANDQKYRKSITNNGNSLRVSAALRAIQLEDRSHTQISPRAEKLISILSSYSDDLIPSDQRHFIASALVKRFKSSNLPAKVDVLSEIIEREALAIATVGIDQNKNASAKISGNSVELSVVRERFTLRQNKPSGAPTHLDLVFDQGSIASILSTSPMDTHSEFYTLSIQPIRAESSSLYPVTFALDGTFQGWELAMQFSGDQLAINVTENKIRTYYWVALLIIVLLAAVMLVVGRYSHEQLHLNRLKNNFIATVSHELKTPLASTRLLLDTLLASEEPFSQRTSEYLQLIIKENKRLARLIDNLLTFSRMEHKRQVFHFEQVDLLAITKRSLEVMLDKLEANDFDIIQDYAITRCDIYADEDMLITAIANLLENAYKYSPKERWLKIQVFKSAHHAHVAISDKGIGLSSSQVTKIFDRFYRVDQRLARETEGSGLGLNIVQYIAQAHNGEIKVESELGQGSCFTLSLPIGRKGGDK